MPSNNPVFGRNFPTNATGQQYGAPQNGGWGQGAPYGAPTQNPYGAQVGQNPYGATTNRYMTMDDVVTKTGLTFLVTVIAAAVTWALLPVDTALALALPAILVGLVLGLVISFKQITNPAAILTYAVVEGVFLGAISEVFEGMFPGIVIQAIVGTFGVFIGMLVVYKTGAIRVTPKLTRWIVGAMFGAVALMLANLVAGIFIDGGLGLRDGGPMAIIFSLIVIGVAAFSLLLDFDMADEAIRRGAPAKFAWYIAFGLLVTMVWLYLEILRLLSYLRN